MSFQTIKINKVITRGSDEVARFRDGYIEPKRRSMSDRRLLATAAAVLLGICFCYCSLFYLPAVLSNRSILAITTQHQTLPQIDYNKKRTALSPFFDLFKVHRGYFRQGQTLQVDFNIPVGHTAEMNIKSCKGIYLLEALSCEQALVSSTQIIGPKRGINRFTAPESGFYVYETRVAEGPIRNIPYSVIWRRVPAK